MNRVSRFWTASVAYVCLLAGSGLSIAGNIADTYRTRGAAMDAIDVIMSVAWPAFVLLAVEMFVSRRWPADSRPLQTLRWLGSGLIGFIAMFASWFHLHDLMASRGQGAIVAGIGPLAIDSLAVMATGLILAGRHHGQQAPATFTAAEVANLIDQSAVATPDGFGQSAVATVADLPLGQLLGADEDYMANLAKRLANTEAMATLEALANGEDWPVGQMANSGQIVGQAVASVGHDVGQAVAKLGQLAKRGGRDAEALAKALAAADELAKLGHERKTIVGHLAREYGVAPRTARRYAANAIKAAEIVQDDPDADPLS